MHSTNSFENLSKIGSNTIILRVLETEYNIIFLYWLDTDRVTVLQCLNSNKSHMIETDR